jgi:hypothetical protein
MKVWIAYLADDGPSLAAFLSEDACEGFCRELSRIVRWRGSAYTTPDEVDTERPLLPPDDFEDGLKGQRRYEWPISFFDLDVPPEPAAAATGMAHLFDEYGEFQP